MWINDQYWCNAAKHAVDLSARYQYVLAPAEICHLISNGLPIEFSHVLSPSVCLVVIPRSDIDLLSLYFCELRSNWRLIHADGAFIIFDFSEVATGGVDQSHELPFVYDLIEQMSRGSPVRESVIDLELSDDFHGRSYVLVACASLTGNAGDRLLAAAAVKFLKCVWPELAFVVVDGRVDRQLIAKAKFVIVGPGGMLFDINGTRTDLYNIANWFRFFHVAKEYSIPFALLGIGDQGTNLDLSKIFVERALVDVAVVSTRDRETANLIVKLTESPVMNLPDFSINFQQEIAKVSKKSKFTLAICGDFRFDRRSIENVLAFCRKRGIRNLSVVLQANEDFEWWEHVGCDVCVGGGLEPMVFDVRNEHPQQFYSVIASASMLVTSRFHGLMVALMSGTPTLVFSDHEDKRERLLREVGAIEWVVNKSKHLQVVDMEADLEKLHALANRKVSPHMFSDRGFGRLADYLRQSALSK